MSLLMFHSYLCRETVSYFHFALVKPSLPEPNYLSVIVIFWNKDFSTKEIGFFTFFVKGGKTTLRVNLSSQEKKRLI